MCFQTGNSHVVLNLVKSWTGRACTLVQVNVSHGISLTCPSPQTALRPRHRHPYVIRRRRVTRGCAGYAVTRFSLFYTFKSVYLGHYVQRVLYCNALITYPAPYYIVRMAVIQMRLTRSYFERVYEIVVVFGTKKKNNVGSHWFQNKMSYT